MKLYKAKGQGIFVNNILNIDTIQSLDGNILLVKYKDGNEAIVDNYNIIADPKAKIEKISNIIENLPKATDRFQLYNNLFDVNIGDIIEYNGEVFIVDQNILNKIKLDIFGDGSCIACYELDGNVNDLSGKWNGVWKGDENYTDGVFGQSAVLDENTGIYSKVHEALDDEFSMTFWFNLSHVIDVNSYSIIFNAGCCLCELSVSDADGKSLYYAAGDSWVWEDSGVDLEANQWYYFAVTYKRSTGLYEIYLNNNKIVSYQNNPSSHEFGYESNAITFGYRLDNSTPHYIAGAIDQIRIFNKILSPDEIQIIYQESAPAIKKII